MEGKGDDADSVDTCGDDEWTVLSRAAESLYNDIDALWIRFIDKNRRILSRLLPNSNISTQAEILDDVPLQMHDLHNEYCTLVEGKVEKWLAREGCSIQDFLSSARIVYRARTALYLKKM